MDIFEITKQKVKDIDVSDTEIKMALDEVEWVILNYCNICNVPYALMYTWANMSADLIRFQFATSGGQTENFNNVSSVKVGDTVVNYEPLDSGFDNTTKALASHLPMLDSIVLNYKSQLQKFRKVRW